MLKTWFPIISWFSLQIEIEFRTFVFGPPAAGDEIVFLCLGRDQKLIIKTSIIIYQIQQIIGTETEPIFNCRRAKSYRLHDSIPLEDMPPASPFGWVFHAHNLAMH